MYIHESGQACRIRDVQKKTCRNQEDVDKKEKQQERKASHALRHNNLSAKMQRAREDM